MTRKYEKQHKKIEVYRGEPPTDDYMAEFIRFGREEFVRFGERRKRTLKKLEEMDEELKIIT